MQQRYILICMLLLYYEFISDLDSCIIILYYFDVQGKHEETIKECTKALELNPTYLKALLRRAEAREKLEQYEESIAGNVDGETSEVIA